jgi:hypothetical protein
VEKAATWRGGGGVEERVVTWRPEDVKRERDEANVKVVIKTC